MVALLMAVFHLLKSQRQDGLTNGPVLHGHDLFRVRCEFGDALDSNSTRRFLSGGG